MRRAELVQFLRDQPWAVEATIDPSQGPQSAVIGVAVTEQLELIFDTLSTSRKHANLLRDPRIALVIGWDQARTVQYEGRADRPEGEALDRAKANYFARFSDGRDRERWPEIAYWIIRPTWIRYSDFTVQPAKILSWDAVEMGELRSRG